MNRDFFNISPSVQSLVMEEEKKLQKEFQKVDELMFLASSKVLAAFQEFNISETDFFGTSGYGYNDVGRDKIEKIFARVLGAEDALVRSQLISGSHALTVTLFGLLRPGDLLLSITGEPYDTLHEVIGIKENPSSLKSFQIEYAQIDLLNDDFDYSKIEKFIKKNQIKVIEIQRSKGYSTRKSLTIDKVEKVVKFIKKFNKDIIIMVDNCYCEFVEDKTPLEVGADIMVGSLIKNLGGGIASNGAYVAGRKELINLVSERLTVPGEGREVGPSSNFNKEFLMGLYHAPMAVGSSLKTAILTSKVLETLHFQVEPRFNEPRADIVQNIIFGNREDLINYCQGIQQGSSIDSESLPVPAAMPGYDDEIIMASGSFTQGSSIEISADGPLREPYILYQQGSLTYEYGKLAVMIAVNNLLSKKN